jgi:hypothetical protein
VTVSPARVGALKRTFSDPLRSHAAPCALCMASPSSASTSMPCAIVPPNGVLAANAWST